ncbi:FAD-binding oxidoreductase [Paracoccus sp. JM45]|uniref:NAD(P)/FAD-dependent oxidoreductase n=1 Tax=Paracoccus sp. JM45 TaxID=2283626 RepID=UPI000E6C52E4|nr:FAD-dependent oxidoreductase [Paracoccus sp. JM45]RJE80102.1 FAD-dependent oxidoreductase [Paracoccus sp. JM45]
MAQGQEKHVVVIGGGIVGVASAERLLQAGCRVTLVEPGEAGGPQAASYGNGAFLSPASIIPMSMPGLWKQVPGYLMNRTAPLTVRWQYLPRLSSWLLRFLQAGSSKSRVTRTASALAQLLRNAPQHHLDLAMRIGAPWMIRSQGLFYLYTDRAAYHADRLAWDLRRQNGVVMQELEGAELSAQVPGLANRYGFAIYLPDGKHCVDPGGYTQAVARWCETQGMSRKYARATGLTHDNGRIVAVRTDQGEIPCDAVVISAGISSAVLARMAGDRIPLETERGYHVELPDADLDLPVPVMPQDLKVAIVRTTGGLRVAGQVEFASASARPDWARADLLRDKLFSCFPALSGTDPAKVKRWQGNRPSTPDGLPVIGPASGIKGVFYAFGHGHIGLNSAPATAAIIAEMVAGIPSALDPTPFAAGRFR